MNLKQLAADLGFEEDEFLDMAQLFVETTFSDLKDLEHAVERSAFEDMAAAAHSIKGAAASFGFDDIRDRALEIERNARGANLQGVPEAIRIIRSRVDLIASVLKGP